MPDHPLSHDPTRRRPSAVFALFGFVIISNVSAPAHAESMNALEPRIQTVQSVLDCRYPFCASRMEHVFVGAGAKPTLGAAAPAALHPIGGMWQIGWSSGFALNLAIVPGFSRANLSYAPDATLRCHVIKLVTTIDFF